MIRTRISSNGLLPHSAILFVALIVMACPAVFAQENATAKTAEVSTATAPATHANAASNASSAPSYTAYKGISIGMSADDVRSKLDHMKEKGKDQDLFVFSNNETAQVFYDPQGKVTAVSVTYMGNNNEAPAPATVLGTEVQPKPDGSIYQLVRYPSAGYWVAYSKINGDSPIVTVTMQKIP